MCTSTFLFFLFSLCVCVCVNGNRVPFFLILCNFIAIFFSAWPSHLARLVLAISKWLCSFFYCYFFSLHVFIYCKLSGHEIKIIVLLLLLLWPLVPRTVFLGPCIPYAAALNKTKTDSDSLHDRCDAMSKESLQIVALTNMP